MLSSIRPALISRVGSLSGSLSGEKDNSPAVQNLSGLTNACRALPEMGGARPSLSSRIQKLPKVDLFSCPAETVWQNKSARVDIVTENGSFHLLVRPVKEHSIETIPDIDYLALKSTFGPISDALEDTFGCSHFAESMLESNQTFGYEILPPPPSSSNARIR